MEETICEIITYWNEINGYDIEEIISRFGYTKTETKKFVSSYIITYKANTGGLGHLIITTTSAPEFYEVNRFGSKDAVITFKKDIHMTQRLYLPQKDLGIVELGADENDPKRMDYYSAEKLEYKSGLTIQEQRKILPDEVKHEETINPVFLISSVKMWAADLRRSLAPKTNIIVKK